MRTKEEVREALGLDALPDDEIMALLDQLGEGDVVTGGEPVEGEGWTAEELDDAVAQAFEMQKHNKG